MTSRVLLVANRTAANAALLEAVRTRALRGSVELHLVMPATPQGLHRVVDPEVAGRQAAHERLTRALPLLSQAAGQEVTGHVGDANPLDAVADALNLQGFDEIIVSTLPWRLSRWLRVDLPSKLRGLGVPVLHVTGTDTDQLDRVLAPTWHEYAVISAPHAQCDVQVWLNAWVARTAPIRSTRAERES